MIQCYFLGEKNEDVNGLIEGTFDILDEFVEAFGKNADKNINIIKEKISLLQISANNAPEFQIAMNLYDLALNVHSRFLEDDKNSYADILLRKAMKLKTGLK